MTSNGTTNGHTNGLHVERSLKPGIFAPIPTFFKPESEDLDLDAFKTHVVRVASAGVGPLLCGSMGEAHHVSHDDRAELIKAAREALDEAKLNHVPLIAGTGAGSTRETLFLCNQAAACGADATIVIASGYYAGVLVNNRAALKAFWTEVAEKSPLPVMIYNYPGASGGIDLDSDLIVELAQSCPNLCGVKLTCGNVGKLTRICATVSAPDFTSLYPRKNSRFPFLVLGGYTDFITPAAVAGGHGAITGLANVAPASIARLFELTSQAIPSTSTFASSGRGEYTSASVEALADAQKLQGIAARADYTIAKAGIAGTKYLLEKLYGYGGAPRRPLPPTSPEDGQRLWEHPDTVALVEVERQVTGKTKAL